MMDEAAVGLELDANEVFPGVWVGGAGDVLPFPHVRLCLHEREDASKGGFRVPIVVPGMGRAVSRRLLDAAASIIQHHVKVGIPILVHCWSGVERSPLAVAWWAKKHQVVKSLPAAYDILEARRPMVQRRLHWLNSKDEV